jgi:pyruvate dehydrogenase E1 component beta subunit
MLDVTGTVTDVNLVQAVNLALKRAMADDHSVLVLGEDVGIDGGVFRATDGLLARYGGGRVLDTPLAEAGIAGVSIGLAAQGFRPVAEIQFTGFAYSCIDQVLSHASRLRARTRGRLTCPMVLRAPAGGGIKAIEHHSESPEAMFAHIPGLKVVIPSSPGRAYGLLLSAIRDPDPVVFLEPTRLYRAVREEVADDGAGVPLERCFVLRSGRDVTLVSWGAMILETLEAAARLAHENIEAEVIDVATLKPLDTAAIVESVARTGRLVIVHEAPVTCGFGAEIAARAAGRALTSLLAPVERVAGYDTMMPYFRTEAYYMPDVERVTAAVRRTMAYT